MKRCKDCGESYPRTNKYFNVSKRTPDGLAYVCKPCKQGIDKAHRNKVRDLKFTKWEYCQSCTKRKQNNTCAVIMEPMEDCWAYSDDIDWLKKVKKQVAEYQSGKGGQA